MTSDPVLSNPECVVSILCKENIHFEKGLIEDPFRASFRELEMRRHFCVAFTLFLVGLVHFL